jgi:hypothetical protein
MKEFVASRFSNGNKLFPSRLIINNAGVTVQSPSWFSGQETTIPFSRISAVNINSPFVGFSTITIQTTGESSISVSGFLKSEVTEMKMLILEQINL